MVATELPLTPEEKTLMVRLLETALGETRVEVHRTHFSPEFREEVKRQESLIRGLLLKVRQTMP